MRFIGNKENLLDKIYQVLQARQIKGDSFFDFFAGTTNVGRYFKKLGYQVYSSDLMYFSYVLQQAYIKNNQDVMFELLLSNLQVKSNALFYSPLDLVLEYLDNLKLQEGFIFHNYTPEGSSDLSQPRMYYSNENGKKIDTIRQQIESWKIKDLINESEYFVLLACLIETVPFYANISGVYAAFQKNWDPRAIKTLKLRNIEIVKNQWDNKVFNMDSVRLINEVSTDILYLDPPYNHRQYAPNYHILETIAKYDNPEIKGVAGLRNYDNQKSKFCNAETGLQELNKIAEKAKYSTLILSYNTEGVMPQSKITATLEKYGNLELVEFDYLRFKSNSNGESKTKKFIQEQLYILTKHEN